MPTRRVLITGLSTYWGGRLAQALEQDERVEAIIGVDNRDPTRELDRTEFVRVGTQHALLRRIVEAAEIDTVVDSRLVVDSVTTSPRKAHENNVIGTMNILAACSHSTVKRFVFKSSAHYYGTAQDDPAFFTEAMARPHPPQTAIEKDIVEAEASVRDFAEKNPQVATSIMRFANVLGPDVRTSHTTLFSLPLVPTILGFDPRYQFVHEDDVVAALHHTVGNDLPGIYNVAADGVLALTEVIDLLGRRWAPLLPPWATGAGAAALRRLGLRIPPEMLGQLRFGRGLDNRKLKATGFEYRYTTRETVIALAEHLRLHPIVRGVQEPYRYEREVEDFLRWSPHVRNPAYRSQPRLSSNELAELRRLHDAYGERVGAPEAGSPADQAEVLARAARVQEPGDDEAQPSGQQDVRAAGDDIAPAAAAGGGAPAAAAEQAPVERYDDLDPEDVVSLIHSLESADLLALRDHERSELARPRVLAAIDGELAQRESAHSG
ncbi:MAG: NAD-dependent epimerase/dehydratase family protein [Actinobacteria bacterium]|nr:NAD-dependent epimerase/dehydratase family protein [Actinomycetota bacterium]